METFTGMKKLIIAEKPSVAKTIAKALGIDQPHDGYLENDRWVVTWCYGHMLKIKEDPRFQKWRKEDLPLIPEKWEYEPVESSKDQLLIIYQLIERKDISSLVCATDAGREGELIFRLVYNQSKTKKSAERMWTSSLEEGAIRDAFNDLRPDSDYDDLYASALARSHADWLVGINATRFYTLYYGQSHPSEGGYSVGRVQTPTLNMVVSRDREIENFRVTKQWSIVKSFDGWKVESERFKDQQLAEQWLSRTEGAPFVVKEVVRTDRKQSPPLLYSLTTLQQDANRRYGMSAAQVLDVVQKLYERKMLTYPRTDSNYITSDMKPTVMAIANLLYDEFLPGRKPEGINRIADDSKVSDHYAIIPTLYYAKNMYGEEFAEDEKKILYLVRNRLMIALSPWCEYQETNVSGEAGGLAFTASGRVETRSGWRELDRLLLKSVQKDTNIFPSDIDSGRSYEALETQMTNRDTRPPAPYTESTLLGAMDRAGAEDMPDDVERKGIGTSATRAGIIENLIRRGYMTRVKRKTTTCLQSTEKGRTLIDMVEDKLKDVKTTAAWEWRLKDIEKGKDSMESFQEGIGLEMHELIQSQAETIEALANSTQTVVGQCPWCGSSVIDRGLRCECTNRDCMGVLYKKSRFFDDHYLSDNEVKLLFAGKQIKMTRTSKKTGKKYQAMYSLRRQRDPDADNNYYSFDMEFINKGPGGGRKTGGGR